MFGRLRDENTLQTTVGYLQALQGADTCTVFWHKLCKSIAKPPFLVLRNQAAFNKTLFGAEKGAETSY